MSGGKIGGRCAHCKKGSLSLTRVTTCHKPPPDYRVEWLCGACRNAWVSFQATSTKRQTKLTGPQTVQPSEGALLYARLRAAGVPVQAEEGEDLGASGVKRARLYRRDDGKCRYCLRQLAYFECTVDHVVPKAQGGHNRTTNLVIACHRCNNRKGNRTPTQAGMTLHSVNGQGEEFLKTVEPFLKSVEPMRFKSFYLRITDWRPPKRLPWELPEIGCPLPPITPSYPEEFAKEEA